MSIIIGIIILGVVIFIHELGHFTFAKANGIVVEEFSLGMGPKLFSFGKGETKYSLKLFPIGGSCAMKGEDEDDYSEGSFQSAKVWKRMLVIIGGPAFNIILGFAVALIVIGATGADPAVIAEVKDGSPAYEAGLRVGDEIVRFNGSRIANAREIYANTNLYGIPTDEIDLTVIRDGEKIDISYEPVVTTSYKAGFYYNADDETKRKMLQSIRRTNDAFITSDMVERYNQLMLHGTGHILLGNRFNLSKMGSGEGSQAFGWGIYLAQAMGVAENYREMGLPKIDWMSRIKITNTNGEIIL